jgi:hypothetical protein
MRFKKVALLSSLTVLAGSIVVPHGSSVNRNTTTNGTTKMQVADGMPLPPLPPTAKSAWLLADGAPLPPLPPTTKSAWLLADGAPLPPLPPTAVV